MSECKECGGKTVKVSPLESRFDFLVCEKCGKQAVLTLLDAPDTSEEAVQPVEPPAWLRPAMTCLIGEPVLQS